MNEKMNSENQISQRGWSRDKLKKQIDKALHPKRWTGKWSLLWSWIVTIGIYISTFVITAIIVLIVDNYISFFNLSATSNPNSARYLLSSLIQSQAAILAIVITITLIAVQLAASSYSPRVIDIFQRNADFIMLLLFYGLSIFLLSGILKIIPEEPTIFQSQIALHTKINNALVVSFFTFTMLFPYILRTLNLLKPSTIIEELAKDITKENILKSINPDKNLKVKDNPLIPIFDIIRSSCLRHDFETTRKGLKSIQDKGIEILKNELSESEGYSVTLLITNELESFGRLVVSIGDDESARESVKVLHGISKIVIEKQFQKSITRINASLKLIGVAAVEKKLLKTAQEAISSLYEIGKISIKINSEISEQSVLLLGDIARGGVQYKLEDSTYKAIRYIRSLGIMGIKNGLETTAKKALWSLELIGQTQVIYEQKLRIEEWEKFVQTWEVEGEIFEEIIEPGGIVREISLFDETLRGSYYIGISSIKENLYSVSANALHTLKIIGKTAIEHRFDGGIVPVYLGHIGIDALEVNNKELANSTVKSLEALSMAVDKNLEDTIYQTAWSLIRVGTVALQKGLDAEASLSAQTLVKLAGNRRSVNAIVNNLFNESLPGIQEFKKLYLEIKSKTASAKVSLIK